MQTEIKDAESFEAAIEYIEDHSRSECRPIRSRLVRAWNAIYADIYMELDKAQLLVDQVSGIVFLGLLAKVFDPSNLGKAVNWLNKLSVQAEAGYEYLMHLPESDILYNNLFHLCLLYKALIDYFNMAKKFYFHIHLARRLKFLLDSESSTAEWGEELYSPVRDSLWQLSCFFQPLKLSYDFLDSNIPSEARTMEIIRQHLVKERQFEVSIRLDSIKVRVLEDAYGTRRGLIAVFDPKRSGIELPDNTTNVSTKSSSPISFTAKRIFIIFSAMDMASVWWLTTVTCCTTNYPPEFPACITHQGVSRIHNQLHSCSRQFLKSAGVTPDDDLQFHISGFGLGGAFAQLSGLRLAANFPNAHFIVQTLSSPLIIFKPPLFNLRLKDRLYILNLFQRGKDELMLQNASTRLRGWTDNKLVQFPTVSQQDGKSWFVQLAECFREEANFDALVKLDEEDTLNPFTRESM